MSKDYIVDVLNDLDEDLLLETAQCRAARKTHYKKWMFPAGIAAVCCIVVSVFFHAGGFGLFAQNSENDLAIESADTYFSLQENEKAEPGKTEFVQEVPSLIVTVDGWTDDGFTGRVTELVDTTAIPVGSRVAVKTDENTGMKLSDDLTVYDMAENKTETGVGKPISVCVMFQMLNDGVIADEADDAEQVYYLYAEQISPVETAEEEGIE